MNKKKNYFKRLTAGIMSVLAMATMITTILTAGAVTDPSLIDRSQDGKASLHITKYEIEDKNVYSSLSHFGTGEQEAKVSEGGNIPNEAKAFKDVTFKIYRIADLDTAKYYLSDGKKLPTADEVTKAQLSSADVIKEATTNENGIASFTNLKLGLYYVEETAHPTQVLEKTAPFVVSIPTTSDTGDKWLYDVYAYPKNETQYADVTINKMDAVNNTPLANVGFTLEESIDNMVTWTAVNNTQTNNKYYTDINGAFTWSHLPAQRYYRINEFSVPNSKYICNDDEYIVFYINSAGEVEIQNADNLYFNIDLQVNDDATNTITIDNDYITTDKFVVYEDGSLGKDTTVKMGSNIDWKITATVPEEMAKMKQYIITDTMGTGLQYVSSTVYGVDKGNKKLVDFTADTDYTLSNTETTNHKVTFTFTTTGCKKAADNAVSSIVVDYKTLATISTPLGTAVENSSSVTYSNKFSTTSNYTTDTTNKPEIHTSGYKLKKITSDGRALSGATFKLYPTKADAENGTNALTFYTYNSSGVLVASNIATSDTNGYVSFFGLTYGVAGNKVNEGTTSYWVVEVSTPSGYNLLKDPFEIKVNQTSFNYAATKTDVVNTSKLELPKTGVVAGAGVTGVGIICLGIALAFAMKKKKNTKTSD